MQIYGPVQLHGPQAIPAPHAARQTNAPQSVPTGCTTDELAISPEAQLLDQIHNLPEIRADRVAQIKASIADGSYETSGRMSVALDRLLDEIG